MYLQCSKKLQLQRLNVPLVIWLSSPLLYSGCLTNYIQITYSLWWLNFASERLSAPSRLTWNGNKNTLGVLGCYFVYSACSEMSLRRKAAAAEEERQRANQAQREAEDERRQANKERQEKTAECLSWREKHHELANILQAHEDLKAQRRSKAVRTSLSETLNFVTLVLSQPQTPVCFTWQTNFMQLWGNLFESCIFFSLWKLHIL